MEYVDGRTLRDLLCDGRRLLPARALEIVDGILRALDYSHRNDIVHRDIKPANVMLTRTGDVKTMDFGIARALSDSQVTMKQTSQVIGTAQYLSPEQARGEQLDARSDLYSTGCLLYELFTGRPPFSGDSFVAIAYQHVRENPVPPSQVDPEIPRWADVIVLKAMAKNPADRYQNAAEMRADIQRVMSGMPVSVPPNPPSPSADRSQPDAKQPREPVEHPARPEAWRVSMHQDAARREAWQGSIGNIGSADLNPAYHATIIDHGGFLSPRKRRARKIYREPGKYNIGEAGKVRLAHFATGMSKMPSGG
jgi:serine/threonine protein kinase